MFRRWNGGAPVKGHHEFHGRGDNIKTSSDRSFGLVFAVFSTLLAAYNGWHQSRWWLFFVALAVSFGIITWWRATWLAPLNRVWTSLGLLLGKITNPVIMGGLFFLVITPIGLGMRMWGHDPLRLRRDSAARSYWIVREPPGPAANSMKEQF
jgi:hypothetical protein